MRGAYVRIVLKSESLGDMHVAIDEAEKNGWQKAGNLLYTYLDGVQGWEIAMEKPIAIDEPDDFYVGADVGTWEVWAMYVMFILVVFFGLGILAWGLL